MNRADLYRKRLGVEKRESPASNEVMDHHELIENAIKAFLSGIPSVKGAGGARRKAVVDVLDIVESLNPRKEG